MDLSVRASPPGGPIKTEIPDDGERSSPDAVTRLSRSPSPATVKSELPKLSDKEDASSNSNPFLKLFPQLDSRSAALVGFPMTQIPGECIVFSGSLLLVMNGAEATAAADATATTQTACSRDEPDSFEVVDLRRFNTSDKASLASLSNLHLDAQGRQTLSGMSRSFKTLRHLRTAHTESKLVANSASQ